MLTNELRRTLKTDQISWSFSSIIELCQGMPLRSEFKFDGSERRPSIIDDRMLYHVLYVATQPQKN